MAYATSPGHPAYTGNFIPEIWSGKLIENFYDATVLSAIANTDYEGDIKSHGDTVNIRTTPELTIRDYVKGQTLAVENPDKPKLQLLIDKGKYFACVEDDVDQVQSDIAMMDTWSKDASERMKITIDTDVLGNIATDVPAANKGLTAGEQSLAIDLGVTGTANALTTSNVLTEIINHGTVLDEANVPESDRWMVIPAKMAGLIKQSDLKDASITGDGSTPLRNGRLGMIDRFMIYVSHNLPLSQTGASGEFTIFSGHKKGLTFASQMTNMETLRSETTFGDIIRGLQVYGFKVVKPEAITAGIITIA
jgi:hypothetical protein|tara:strand:+ start:7693 stop:8613 length:921 start_codon:yes stop_codon:yes gene_type:complete